MQYNVEQFKCSKFNMSRIDVFDEFKCDNVGLDGFQNQKYPK